MKFSKLMAGVAALAMSATMAISASATTDYLYLVKGSWNGNAPTDSVEGQIKFQDATAKGACDLNEWDTGAGKYNGEWAQCLLTSDDLSSVSITFTLKTTDATLWEAHTYDDSKSAEEQVYQLFMTLDQTETLPYETITQPEWVIEEILDADGNPKLDADGNVKTKVSNNGTMTATCSGEWTYTYSGDVISAAVESGKAQLAENEDGTYTLGFNIQVGHVANILVTGEVTADNLCVAESDTSVSANGTTSSTSSSTSSTSSTASTSSSASTTSKTITTTTTSTASTASTATTSTASDNTNSATGATAGIALAGLALAGAAAVVAKRK